MGGNRRRREAAAQSGGIEVVGRDRSRHEAKVGHSEQAGGEVTATAVPSLFTYVICTKKDSF